MLRSFVIAAVLTAATSVHAFGVMASLVSQRTGTSVSGQTITICTYQANGQRFEHILPGMTFCPMSITVQ